MVDASRKDTLPPMMQRYLEFKERYPDALLFFQVGDFYELFFDDAVTVAKSLNLTLTSRDKNAAQPIPMCGVPLSVLDGYVDRLLPLGYSVAVVAQSGSGAGVDRVLERFVTPAMRLFTTVTSDSAESIVAALAIEPDGRSGALSCTDPQTGVVRVKDSIEVAQLAKELANLSAREVIVPRSSNGEKYDRRTSWIRGVETVTGKHAIKFRSEGLSGSETLVALDDSAKAAFHSLSPSSKRATRLLLSYLDEVSLGNAVPVREIAPIRRSGYVVIDAATRRNLELVQNAKDGGTTGTLFGLLNSTATPGGARALRSWILGPLDNRPEIERRQEAIRQLIAICSNVNATLSGLSDLERLAARLELNVANPKDLAAIRDTLERLPSLSSVLSGSESSLLKELSRDLAFPNRDLEDLKKALVDNPPHLVTDGGVIRDGFDPELDHIRSTRSQADAWRMAFEQQERGATGISSLKVKCNNVIGYFIEVSTAQTSKVPAHYIRRQSTANADRFTTPELKAHEEGVVTAVDRQIRREQALFTAVREQVRPASSNLRRIASAMAAIDALAALAYNANKRAWTCPIISENSSLSIKRGRHPIVADLLDGAFIPNSVEFRAEGERCFLVTGPNMGGKSTYLRQTALIVILAQMGSFVPADSASVGLVDRVFARLGASDDLHEGESTFMVEMREAAHIIAHASERSLVLIDELGRGTATSDGLSLAQAILEQLAFTLNSRTLFATHYHELTGLEGVSSKIRNLSVGSIEEADRVVFTHEIMQGSAPRSYGIEVAKLSGLPTAVIHRASEILSEIERNQSPHSRVTVPKSSRGNPIESDRQRNLFNSGGPTVMKDPVAERVKDEVTKLDVDSLSAREALQYLYGLKELVRGK